MRTKVFSKGEWMEVLGGLGEAYEVYVPVRDGDFHSFRLLDEGTQPDLAYENTRLSPKGLVYPQSERMFEYTLDEGDADAHILKEAPKTYRPRAIVGIRPCDAQAFGLVKRNFDNPEYRDPWWVKRYELTTLVGYGCSAPCSTCFCTSVGGGPFDGQWLDVLVYDLGERLVVKELSEKGEAFVGKARGGSPAGEEALAEAARLAEEAAAGMGEAVPTGRLGDKEVTGLFGAPFWEEVSFACLNCGTCTYLCPTCWCFDIQDEVWGRQGDRIRTWDSCMFPLFTHHGSGHNPREKKVQRVRQRFMHKLKYYVDKYAEGVQCSGCGRCVRYCPVNIDIRQVCRVMDNY
jgi:sulfhydrogenase subunit beta (sulfur reductase)